MFRLVRLAHLLLQGLTSLESVGPESLDRSGTSFFRALLLPSGFRLPRAMCCLFFPVSLFSIIALLMRCSGAGDLSTVHGMPVPYRRS